MFEEESLFTPIESDRDMLSGQTTKIVLQKVTWAS